MRFAIEHGWRPTTLILKVAHPRGKWSKEDHLLAEAYRCVLNETCSQCGMPTWICHNDDEQNLSFRSVERTCNATRTLKTDHDNMSKKPGYKEPLGTTASPEPYMLFGDVDPYSLRRSYYENEAKKRLETLDADRE